MQLFWTFALLDEAKGDFIKDKDKDISVTVWKSHKKGVFIYLFKL